jgi:hypothetical protein
MNNNIVLIQSVSGSDRRKLHSESGRVSYRVMLVVVRVIEARDDGANDPAVINVWGLPFVGDVVVDIFDDEEEEEEEEFDKGKKTRRYRVPVLWLPLDTSLLTRDDCG